MPTLSGSTVRLSRGGDPRARAGLTPPPALEEVKSLVVQIAHLYGLNRRSPGPVQLHLTSLDKRCRQGLENIAGFENWWLQQHDKAYDDVFGKEEVVYLTAESPNVLEEMDRGKVLVIGGMVDHNRIKGCCQAAAEGKGVATARLPLDDVDFRGNRKVLAVNHVFELLLRWHEGKTWKECCDAVIPARTTGKQGGGGGGAGAG